MFLSQTSKVIGVEVSKQKLELIGGGRAPFFEPKLDEALAQSLLTGSITISPTPVSNNERNVFVITVGTPIQNGQVNLDYLGRVVTEVASVAKDEDLVIVRSTVSLGTTRELVARAFQKLGLHLHVAMCPERTIEGTALQELRDLPQIVGGVDRQSTILAASFFESHGILVEVVESSEAAELCKLAANTYRDLQFAFANELALLGDALDINVRQVVEATNRGYSRANIATPGPSAGPCLEKDPWILVSSGESLGLTMRTSRAAREINERVPLRSLSEFKHRLGCQDGPKRILLAGIAFKGSPETDDTRGSLAFPILDELLNDQPSIDVYTYDPIATHMPEKFQSLVSHLVSLDHCVTSFDGLIVQHPGKTLHQGLAGAAHLFENAWILDFWGKFEHENRDRIDGDKVRVFGGRLA